MAQRRGARAIHPPRLGIGSCHYRSQGAMQENTFAILITDKKVLMISCSEFPIEVRIANNIGNH